MIIKKPSTDECGSRGANAAWNPGGVKQKVLSKHETNIN
jgi:hypothetical protein